MSTKVLLQDATFDELLEALNAKTDEENRKELKAFAECFYPGATRVVLPRELSYDDETYYTTFDKLGARFYKGDELIERPSDPEGRLLQEEDESVEDDENWQMRLAELVTDDLYELELAYKDGLGDYQLEL